ncbi:MAG: DUF4097 family beta strand repeat-containing protein [Pirellula sp.]
MKLVTPSIASCLVGIAMFAGCDVPQFSATQVFEKTIPINSVVDVIAETHNGSIEVSPCESQEIQLVAHLKSYGNTQEEADSRLDSLIPQIETTDGSVTIHANKSTERLFSMDSVRYELKVPSSWPVRLVTSNGKITSNGNRGPVTIKTSNGRIKVSNAIGSIEAVTSNGAISIEDSLGKVQAKSSNGSIKLENCTLDGDSRLRTSNGSIEVLLSPITTVSIKASTSNGSIRFDDQEVEAKQKSSRSLNALMHGSSESIGQTVQLELGTSNGSITIKKKHETNGSIRVEKTDL